MLEQPARRSLDRLIQAGIAPRRARRILREFSEHHADLVAEQRALGAGCAEAEAEAVARLGTEQQLVANLLSRSDLRSWARRRPGVAFALTPVLSFALAFAMSLFAMAALVNWRKAPRRFVEQRLCTDTLDQRIRTGLFALGTAACRVTHAGCRSGPPPRAVGLALHRHPHDLCRRRFDEFFRGHAASRAGAFDDRRHRDQHRSYWRAAPACRRHRGACAAPLYSGAAFAAARSRCTLASDRPWPRSHRLCVIDQKRLRRGCCGPASCYWSRRFTPHSCSWCRNGRRGWRCGAKNR